MRDINTLPKFQTISDLYLHSLQAREHLRIGVLLDTSKVFRSVATVLRDIIRSDFAKLQLLVFNAAAQQARSNRLCIFERLWPLVRNSHARATLLWQIYNHVDRRVWQVDDGPLEPEDCQHLLKGIESMEVLPIASAFADRFPEDAVSAIRSKNLDVLLHFGFNVMHGDILNAAKYGVWSFHHGDTDYYRGGPEYFWELCEHNPISATVLQILGEEPDSCRVLAKASFPTQTGLSLIRNRVQPYWSSTHLVIQKLWELHTRGWNFVERRTLPPTRYRGKKKVYTVPTNIEMVRWLVSRAARKLYEPARLTVRRSANVAYWQIGIRTGGHFIQGADGAPDTAGFQWIKSPAGHFYADPFVFERYGQHWVFFEDYDYERGRAAIACAYVSPSGVMDGRRIVLEDDVHLSYPNVFSEGDSVYMIPESGSANVVRLYQCTHFPDAWSLVAELFHGPAVDTSLCKQGDLWWFFTTLMDPRGHGIALYLFFSKSLTGEWQYHPANPISNDIRNARGAGRLFWRNGRLIRPSQNSVWRYGYSFALNEILRLSPSEYQERVILSVEPHWCRGLQGTHTYNQAGTIEAIDGQTFGRR